MTTCHPDCGQGYLFQFHSKGRSIAQFDPSVSWVPFLAQSTGHKTSVSKIIITLVQVSFLKNNYLFLAMLGLCCIWGLSPVVVSRADSLAVVMGFSLWWLLFLWSMGCRAHGLSGCGSVLGLSCPKACRSSWTRDPTSVPALASRFLTTGLPGRSSGAF